MSAGHNGVSGPVYTALAKQQRAEVLSPLLGKLIQASLDDIAAGGPVARVLAHVDPALDPEADAVPLRFLGAVHRVVLDGRAPGLAAHYPSAGGTFDVDDPASVAALGAAFVATVGEHEAELIEGLGRGVQTNEVARCASLLPGFLRVAATTGLPLRILEIGSSGGLLLRWDHFRYEGGRDGSAWGDPAAPLRFVGNFADPAPDLDVPATVVSRAGCDANPIDPGTREGLLTLHGFVWPDQLERHAQLDAAVEASRDLENLVVRADAADFLEEHLASPVRGVATVVFHSIVWQYLTVATRTRVRAAIEGAGARATDDAPVAWLRMEPGDDYSKAAEVRLTQWPGGEEQLVARTGYHGRPVRMRA